MLGIILLTRRVQFIIQKKKSKKGIFGKANIREINELKDEGINTQVIPWFKDKEN